jgi:hypothetical protein
MNRRLLAVLAAVAAAATCAPATAATGTTTVKPQVRDAAGDWKVASQDILDATVTATAKQIRGDLHLSAPLAQGIPGKYDIGMYVGCAPYSLHFTWNGGLPGSTATLDQYACSTGGTAPDEIDALRPIASTPATATLTPTGIRIVAAPTKALHRGVRVSAFVETWLAPVIVFSPGFDFNQPSYGGDVGVGDGMFRLGS